MKGLNLLTFENALALVVSCEVLNLLYNLMQAHVLAHVLAILCQNVASMKLLKFFLSSDEGGFIEGWSSGIAKNLHMDQEIG